MHVKATSGSIDTFPYNVGQLRRDNPNTSFPKRIPEEILAEWDVYPVTENDIPSYNERTQKIERDANPTLVNNVWTIGWTVTDKTSEEIQQYDDNMAASNRSVRDGLLAQTDFHALSDMTMSAAITTYRQALRDITTNANWPNLADDDWPTKP